MAGHPIFSFSDAQYIEAFKRGVADAKAGRPAPGGASGAVEFLVDAGFGAGPKRGELRLRLLVPLVWARFRGWQMGALGHVHPSDVTEVSGASLRIWRREPHLAFAIEEREDPAFDDSELALWGDLSFELSAEGIEPISPMPPVPRFGPAGLDLLTAAAEREAPLLFPAAEALSPEHSSVTVSVVLSGERRSIDFALR